MYQIQRLQIPFQKLRIEMVHPLPAEPGYALSSQTVYIHITWLLKKPTDLDLHCFALNMWTSIINLDQVIWKVDMGLEF